MKTPKITVFKLFGASISSREQADALYLRVKKCSNRVIVDFSKVKFISRSFADQFYKRFLELNKEIAIEVINGSAVVADMLNAVSQTQQVNSRTQIAFNMQSFVSRDDLKVYLLSID